MVVKVQPVTPSLPATTTIQDPAARRFAQSVADILRTHQSTEYAVQQLTLAAEGLIGGGLPGTPPSIQEWLASSELYEKLRSAIERIDIEAKRAIIEEQEARVQAIADEAESRANEIALEIAARIAAVQAEADLRAQGLLAEAEARGAAIASEATVRQSEDESIAQSVTTLTSSVNNSLAGIEEELTTLSTNLGAEASERQTLAAQMRGSYTGNDLSGITTGLLYQERIARATADQGLAQQITLLSAGTGEQFDHFNIWYFDDGVEGWVGNGAPTVTGGWLRPANHATDPYVSSPAGLGAEGSTYSQVRVRVRKTGSPAWAGVLYWRGAADSTWDVARSASFPEPVFDANGIGLATVNLTWTGEIDRIRIDLSMAQTATDFFEIDWIAVGRPSPGASAAALLQEQIARASADAAEAASREALSVKLVGQADPDNLTLGTIASGLLYDEKLARSTADSTEVSKRESLSAKLTGFNDPTGKTLVDLSSGLIYEEKVARANEVEAVALTVTALVTRMGEAESAITTEQTTRSNADSAMASSITGLTAQFGGNTTYSVLKQFDFVSGVEGWVGVGATISNAGGSYLAMVTTAANPYISYTLPTADRYQGSLATKIRARIRRISGASVWEGRCYYTTAAHNASDSYRKVVAAPKDPATWTIVEWDMSALTNGGNDYATNEIRAIRLDLVSGAGDAWDIDWISIGEKVVSPASYDVQQVNAAITDEAKVRADADTATTSRINTMRSQLGVTEEGALVEGFILEERNTRSSNDSAIVSAVNTALASITGVSNAISQSGENLISNWTSAQATKWNQIEAEVVGEGGNTIRAALAEEALVRSNADGSLGAQWTLKTDINGYVSGFGFASTANNATPTSEFIIRADKFAVVMPGYGDYVPFAVGSFGPMLLDSGGFNVPINDLVSASANPTSFLESFQSGNLAQWTNHGGSGELSVVSASNSLTGGKVLRIGNNSGDDQAWLIHKQNIPFDPSALYRIKFRVRRTAGTGTVYLGLAGVASDGTTWVSTSGTNSTSSQHYVAAHSQNPGAGWTEYVGYVKGTAAAGQTGTNPPVTAPLKLHQNVKYIRPLIIANYPNAAGVMEVDYCSIELMTDAMSWDAVAGEGKDAIVNTLADIASDSKLTPAEKKITKKELDGIVAEKSGINSQASELGITDENNTYDNAYNALNTYITPLLSSLTTTSNIVGSTFRSTFSTFYSARQALLNKISDVASKSAKWSLIAARPDDSSNLVEKSVFSDGSRGTWGAGTVVGISGQPFSHALEVSARDCYADGWFPVTPGEKLYVSAWLDASTCNGQLRVGINAQTSAGANQWLTPAFINAGVGWTFVTGEIVVPSDCIRARGFIQILLTSNFGTGRISFVRLSRTQDGATVGAPVGTLVAGVPAASVATAITDFNASNNRNGSAITDPTILTNGTAVDHVAQKDGSVDISFEWGWSGNEGDIDGFLVYARPSTSSSAYTLGTTPAEETVYTVPANKRAFVLFGVAADKYYTFGVQAYRAVDKAINAAGVIKSALVKATGSGENPYRPSSTVAFTGDVTGTISGTDAATLVLTASNALTAADAAQEDATKALDDLADIAADNKLTPAEKKSIRKEWDAIYAERAGIRAQADSFGITTEKTNYDNDFQALGTYLNGGTAYTIGATPPSWITDANLATTTTIVGTTFRNYWKNLYADRQALLNKIAAEAAKRADWTLTAGKPDDEDLLNTSHPLNKNPDLQGAVSGANSAPNWTRVVAGPEPAFAGIRIEAAGSTYGPPWDREAPMFYATIADTANAPNEQAYWVSEGFKIDASKPHCLSGWARKMWSHGTPKVYFRVRCYDKDGVSLGFISHYSAYTGLTTTWTQMVKKIEPADWPAGTYKVRIEWHGAYQQYGSSVATRLMLNEGRVPTKNLAPPVVDIDAHLTRNGTSVLANDFVATWNKISSSNVLNYMGPTAITAAVIGTAAIETAKIKDGAITTAKIGDAQIETAHIKNAQITTAKIGDAAVDTLRLADNSVTVSSVAAGSSTSAPISTTLNVPANQTLRVVAIGFLPGRKDSTVYTSHSATVSIDSSALTQTAGGAAYNEVGPIGDSTNTKYAVPPITIVHSANVSGGATGKTVTVSIESTDVGTKRIVAFGMLK